MAGVPEHNVLMTHEPHPSHKMSAWKKEQHARYHRHLRIS